MPSLDAAAYRGLAGIADGRPAFGLELAGASRGRLEVCARCHGAPGAVPPVDIVPQLSGQSRAYLERALHDYADGRRPSGYMQFVAAMLDDEEIRELAGAYAEAAMPRVPVQAAPAELLQRGEAIAREGLPAKGVPACLACHADARNPAFPRVLGLSSSYIEQQLRLFREGKRDATTYGPIMKAVAVRLDDSSMTAVGAYLASLPGRPAP
jgi:cytochrome c553